MGIRGGEMLKGFKDFISRGNVVDLAVAVIIGAAFQAIVVSLVNDILKQLIAAVVGKPDFSYIVFKINGTPILIGNFVAAAFQFLLVASCLYFGVVVPLNKLQARTKKAEPEKAPTTKICGECLSEIPLAAKRCRFCGERAEV